MLNAGFSSKLNEMLFVFVISAQNHELWLMADLMTPHLSFRDLSFYATSLWPYVLHFLFQQFIIVTYILAFIWLAVFAFTAIPVFFLFNMEQTCHNINILAETTPSINQHGWICMDARQYGVLFFYNDWPPDENVNVSLKAIN